MMLRRILLFVLMLLATACGGEASAEPTAIGRAIESFCKSESLVGGPATPTAAAACIARQRQALKHYLGIAVMFDAGEADAKVCMVAAKVGRHVDWVKAEACLRAWSKGRENIVAKGMKRE